MSISIPLIRKVPIRQSSESVRDILLEFGNPVYVVDVDGEASVTSDQSVIDSGEVVSVINANQWSSLGDPGFCEDYNVIYPYYAGAMANGINSVDMVVALGKERILSVFGAGGLSVHKVIAAIKEIKNKLPKGPFAINLLHNPGDQDWELSCVQNFIDLDVNIVEASAYVNISMALVYYRLSGLFFDSSRKIVSKHKIIAKVSRPEVAKQFMSPPAEKLVRKLLKKGLISQEQADSASRISMADDITVESDSGGHTDHGIASCILPDIIQLRNSLQEKYRFDRQIRVGSAGGIGTPAAAYGAFSMGAAYIVTGSINQACEESGTSDLVREMLRNADTSDVASAPSADMFELGAKVQVLKSNTMFSVRSQKLYSLYKQYDSIDSFPESELARLEKQIFRKSVDAVWHDTVEFFSRRGNLDHIKKSESNPKKKMALIFQWYLGQSSKWAIDGNEERKFDYQVWCGPSMGACNNWLSGSALAEKRFVTTLAHNLMLGSIYLHRVNDLCAAGYDVPVPARSFRPVNNKMIVNIINSVQAVGRIDKLYTTNTNEFDQSTRGKSTMETDTQTNSGKKLNLQKSKDYYQKTWDLLPGGAHYNFADPERALVIPFNKGRDSRVWDLDGNEHLDLFCKFGALFVGHHNKKYNETLMDYMNKVTSVDTCDLEYDVCAMMSNHIPCAEMIRFGLSGTEAVQNALRLARAYTKKNRFIRFHGHYHGNADNIMGGRKKKDLAWPVPERFKGDMLDTQGRAEHILEEQSFLLPWNDIEALETVISQHAGEIAAVLMEPICMNGGGILPREGYLEKTKAICEKHNIVLIFDEIITGVRIGLGGAQKILGVTPHLATFGKALGGGSMPISAIAGQKDIMNLYTKGKVIHAGTFNGYPLGLAAIKATYELIENDPECYSRLGSVMGEMTKVFVEASRRVGIPMVVQGMPTALVYHSQDRLVDRSEGYTDRVKFCDIIIREICKRYGLQFSPLSRLYPNLLINDSDVEFFSERIFDAMENAKKIIDITFKEGEIA